MELKTGYYLSIDKDGQPSVYRNGRKLDNVFEYMYGDEEISSVYVSNGTGVVMIGSDKDLYIPYVYNNESLKIALVGCITEEEMKSYSYSTPIDRVYKFSNYVTFEDFSFPIIKMGNNFYECIPVDMAEYKEYMLNDRPIKQSKWNFRLL